MKFYNKPVHRSAYGAGPVSTGGIILAAGSVNGCSDTRYQLDLNWNDITAPVVASAAALQSAIEAMIISGWGGGGGGTSGLQDNLMLMGG